MTKRFPLQTLLDLSHARLDDAARLLGKMVASEQEVAKKLAMLHDYRSEYHGRFLEAARTGLTPDQWQNYRSFLGKLDQAIAQQTQLVENSRRRISDGQQAWIAQRGKTKAFDTLSDRHHQAMVKRQGQLEQKITDEHAAKNRGPEPEGE